MLPVNVEKDEDRSMANVESTIGRWLLKVQLRAEIDCDQHRYNVKIFEVIGFPKRPLTMVTRGLRL